MGLLRKKTHEYDEQLHALVIAKSKTLIRFIQTHPAGADYARKRILETKYDLSRVNKILYGFFMRSLHLPLRFRIDHETYLTSSRDVGMQYAIEDRNHPFGNIQYNQQDREIRIDNGKFVLTKNNIDREVFMSVYNALKIREKNENIIDFNVQSRAQLENYEKHYGKDYP